MSFLIGIKNHFCWQATGDETICPDCSEQGCITVVVNQRYAHLLGIPVIAESHYAAAHCGHCDYFTHHKEFSVLQPELLSLLREHSRYRPWWQYIGLIGLAILLVIAVLLDSGRVDKSNRHISQPEAGDRFYVEVTSTLFFKKYTSYLVDSLSADSVWLRHNLYAVEEQREVEQIDREENYAGPQAHPRSYLEEFKKDIVDIRYIDTD